MNKNHVKSVLTFCKKRKMKCTVHWENGEGQLINDMPSERVDYINVVPEMNANPPWKDSFTAGSLQEFNEKLKQYDDRTWSKMHPPKPVSFKDTLK